MDPIYADIELINGEDLVLARKQYIGVEEIKSVSLNILVDTGYNMLAINETIQKKLKLPVLDKKNAQLANGQIVVCDVVGPVELRIKKFRTTCTAIVLPGDSEPHLGKTPIQDMDVEIYPVYKHSILTDINMN